jgi:hypothetical protein
MGIYIPNTWNIRQYGVTPASGLNGSQPENLSLLRSQKHSCPVRKYPYTNVSPTQLVQESSCVEGFRRTGATLKSCPGYAMPEPESVRRRNRRRNCLEGKHLIRKPPYSGNSHALLGKTRFAGKDLGGNPSRPNSTTPASSFTFRPIPTTAG